MHFDINESIELWNKLSNFNSNSFVSESEVNELIRKIENANSLTEILITYEQLWRNKSESEFLSICRAVINRLTPAAKLRLRSLVK